MAVKATISHVLMTYSQIYLHISLVILRTLTIILRVFTRGTQSGSMGVAPTPICFSDD